MDPDLVKPHFEGHENTKQIIRFKYHGDAQSKKRHKSNLRFLEKFVLEPSELKKRFKNMSVCMSKDSDGGKTTSSISPKFAS